MPIEFVKRDSLSVDLSNSQLEIFLGDTDFLCARTLPKIRYSMSRKKRRPTLYYGLRHRMTMSFPPCRNARPHSASKRAAPYRLVETPLLYDSRDIIQAAQTRIPYKLTSGLENWSILFMTIEFTIFKGRRPSAGRRGCIHPRCRSVSVVNCKTPGTKYRWKVVKRL